MTNDFKLGFCPPESLRRVKPWGPALEIQRGHMHMVVPGLVAEPMAYLSHTCLRVTFDVFVFFLHHCCTLCVIMSYLDKCHSVRSVAESLVPRNHLGSPTSPVSCISRIAPYRWICRVSGCRLISIPSSLHRLRPSFCAPAPFTKQIPPPPVGPQWHLSVPTYSRAQKSLSPTADIVPYSHH